MHQEEEGTTEATAMDHNLDASSALKWIFASPYSADGSDSPTRKLSKQT